MDEFKHTEKAVQSIKEENMYHQGQERQRSEHETEKESIKEENMYLQGQERQRSKYETEKHTKPAPKGM